jgi:hypothetical protein
MPLVKDKTKTHCLIGKVTYKHAPIVSFPSRMPQGKAQAMVNHARDCLWELPGSVDGYIIIACDTSTPESYSLRLDPGSRRQVIDMPSLAEELIRWSWQGK